MKRLLDADDWRLLARAAVLFSIVSLVLCGVAFALGAAVRLFLWSMGA